MKETLRALRLESGLTQKELAKILNSTDKNVWAYEKGIATPPYDILAAYANYFGVTTDYLIGRTDEFGGNVEQKNIIERPPYDITDKQLFDFMKLYKVMTELQKAQVFGYVVAMLESAGVNVQNVLNR